MLRVEDLTVRYGEIAALQAVDLSVGQQETVAIIGANGAGKTTLLKTISGLMRPVSGRITWEDSELHRLPPHRIVAKGVCHVPEGRRVFPDLTVWENLRVGAKTLRSRRQIREAIERNLELFPVLRTRVRQSAGTLSGGEQQMLAIARALVSSPKLLLLDEPSLGLAPLMVDRVFETIQRIQNEGVAILLVEQNAYLALETATRGYVLRTGEILLEGPAERLVKDPTVRDLYLGAA